MRRIIVINEKEENNALYERVLSKVYVNHYLRNFDDYKEALKFLKINVIHYIIIDKCDELTKFLEKLEKIKPEANAIIVVDKESNDCISTALKHNAKGIISINKLDKELNKAIEQIESGERFFSSEIAPVALKALIQNGFKEDKNQPSLKDLTKREIQILELILDELTNFEIAEKLYVSPRTIDTHRRNLLQKVRAKNTVGLVKFAFRNKLIV